MFDNIRADLDQATKHNLAGTRLKVLLKPSTFPVISYRFTRWVETLRIPVVRHLLLIAAALIRYFVELLTGVHISPEARIGPGFVVHLPYGVFVGAVTIGRNCVVQQGVVIGWGTRGIGDDVYFGPGAKVMGTARIGNNVLVVANSTVLTDVPDNTTVAGVPARIRWRRGRSFTMRPSDGRAAAGRPQEERNGLRVE
jgi:serine O-acetyltransferase